jgi:hypothetical protein
MIAMKTIAFILLTLSTGVFGMAPDTTKITATINGKPVEFRSNTRAKLVQRSVALLASCAYMDTTPKWGAPAQPQTMADAQKHSHLRLVFATPMKVEVPIEKVSLQAREMVITLPVAAAGIWVRTSDGITYLAKFNCTIAGDLQELLDRAQKP